jgi:hypothetical protein
VLETYPHPKEAGDLAANPIVKTPDHRYWPRTYPESVVQGLHFFAASLQGLTGNYPNRKLQLEPWPAYMANDGRLTFAFVWGKRTEFPSPKESNIAPYFGSFLVGTHFKRRPQRHVALDAQGFLGVVQSEGDQLSRVHVAMGSPDSTIATFSSHLLYDAGSADLAAAEVVSDLATHRPLRFNESVIWNPGNHYIGNDIAPDDEADVLDRLKWSDSRP